AVVSCFLLWEGTIGELCEEALKRTGKRECYETKAFVHEKNGDTNCGSRTSSCHHNPPNDLTTSYVAGFEVDENDKIKVTYSSPQVDSSSLDSTCRKAPTGYFKINATTEAERDAVIGRITDYVFYVTSDKVSAYGMGLDAFGYNNKRLPLSDDATYTIKKPYDLSPFYVFGITIGTREIVFSEPTDACNIDLWISTPGIYRANLAKRTINQIFYDPLNQESAYLT
ncbi:hypothetical protein PFISCL1PPCAC_5277, partial [Pristionchus fissidentatus]